MNSIKYFLLVPFVFALFLSTGCSSIPWLSFSSSHEVGEVAGTYQIRHFEFAPETSKIEKIDVLKYVEKEGLELKLTKSQDFVLEYQTQDGEQVTLTGTYSVTPKKVELRGQRGDAELYQQILLDRTFYLLRKGPSVLWVDTKKSVAAEKLSSSYEGLASMNGTLRVEFAKRQVSASR